MSHDRSPLTAELRRTFLFESLDAEPLTWLVAHGEVVALGPGAEVYGNGHPAAHLFVLLDGEVAVTRRVENDVVTLWSTDRPGSFAGPTRAFAGHDGGDDHDNGLVAVREARLFRIDADDFHSFLARWFPLAVHLLDGLLVGVRDSEATARQHDQLAWFTTLSAGLAHELNNPAAAGVRATAQLSERLGEARSELAGLVAGTPLAALVAADAPAPGTAPARPLSPLAWADEEEKLASWLHEQGVHDEWLLAPALLGAGFTPDELDRRGAGLAGDDFVGAVRWLAADAGVRAVLAELDDAVQRIVTLVDTVKRYSSIDEQPSQRVDVRQGIDSTLTLLRHKLDGVTVERHYDDEVPTVCGHAGELNQVWTNLIDNAITAMAGSGVLTVRVGSAGADVRVDVVDTGDGIPDDVRPHIFDAFFTGRPQGTGTGLGLEIVRRVVRRHGGDVDVRSRPGQTCFTVRLPVAAR